MHTDWFTKFILAWAAGVACLIAFPFILGEILVNVVQFPDAVSSQGALMLFLTLIMLVPLAIGSGIIAAVCGSLAANSRKSVLSSAAVNLGIVFVFILLSSGMLPSIDIGLH